MTKSQLMNLFRALAARAELEADELTDPYRRGLQHGLADAYNLAAGWAETLEVSS